MRYIGIDPSLNSTAVCIDGKSAIFVNKKICFNKKENLTKWFSVCEEQGVILFGHSYFKHKNYSEQELSKLNSYLSITDSIVSYIGTIIDNRECKVYIEGYSQQSQAGPIVDLVTLSTLLRYKILNVITRDLTVISPMGLKMHSAQLSYPATYKGKKRTYKNHDGLAGGRFKKPDMLKCIADNSTWNDHWATFIKNNKEELLSHKNTPKPIDDINDAYLLYQVAKSS